MRIPSGVTDQVICSKCKQEKPVSDFGKDKKISRGIKYSCKGCVNEERRGRYKKENRAYLLKSKYGLSPEDYESMVDNQKGLCAICCQVPENRSGGGRAKPSIGLYVDHDAVSGEVRGLLCHKCNVAIGLLYDDPSRIERAANYVRGMPCVL